MTWFHFQSSSWMGLFPLALLSFGCSGVVSEDDGGVTGGAAGWGAGPSASGGASSGGSNQTGTGGVTGGTASTGGAGGDSCAGFESDPCGACSCTEDGIVCLDIACPEPECTDGETLEEDCSFCSCSGGQWLCTGAPCVEPECVDGEESSDGCNSCVCTDGQWACTDRACPEAECLDGETKDDGCNSCACEDGFWLCRERACEAKGCGGWLGNTCTEEEYCAYVEGEHCGAADASSVCRVRPEVCDAQYDPVCGCNGKTYSNDCMAASSGTGILHAGACE